MNAAGNAAVRTRPQPGQVARRTTASTTSGWIGGRSMTWRRSTGSCASSRRSAPPHAPAATRIAIRSVGAPKSRVVPAWPGRAPGRGVPGGGAGRFGVRAWDGGTDEFAGVFGGRPLVSSSSAIRACNRRISSISSS